MTGGECKRSSDAASDANGGGGCDDRGGGDEDATGLSKAVGVDDPSLAVLLASASLAALKRLS